MEAEVNCVNDPRSNTQEAQLKSQAKDGSHDDDHLPFLESTSPTAVERTERVDEIPSVESGEPQNSPLFIHFTIILKTSLGYLVGRIEVNGFNLGTLVMAPTEWAEFILTYMLGARITSGKVLLEFLNETSWSDLKKDDG